MMRKRGFTPRGKGGRGDSWLRSLKKKRRSHRQKGGGKNLYFLDCRCSKERESGGNRERARWTTLAKGEKKRY